MILTDKPEPSEPRLIKAPRYDAVLRVEDGELVISRNDKDGKLSYEDVNKMVRSADK